MGLETLKLRLASTLNGDQRKSLRVWEQITHTHLKYRFPDFQYLDASFDIFWKLRDGMRSDPRAFEWALWLQHLGLDFSLPDYGAKLSATRAKTLLDELDLPPRLIRRTCELIRSRDPLRPRIGGRSGMLRDIHHYASYAASIDRAVQVSINMGKRLNAPPEKRTELIGVILLRVKTSGVYRHPYLREYEEARTCANITAVQANLRYLFR